VHFLNGLKYRLAGRFYLPTPLFFALGVTSRCNSRCVMCSIWKNQTGEEFDIDEIEKIFGNPVLKRLEIVTLSGGEPFLREDLPEIIEIICRSCRSIKCLSINSNGLESGLIESQLNQIFSLPFPQISQGLSLQISIDGYGEVHDKIRGVNNAFEKVKETLQKLKTMQSLYPLNIQIVCVVQNLNITDLPLLSKFARSFEIPIRYNPVLETPANTSYYKEELMPKGSQLQLLKKYFNDSMKDDLDLSSIAFWKEYFRMMEGKKRKFPCALPYYGLFLGAEGNLFICGEDLALVYGNVHEESLDTIWSSKRAQELRKHCIANNCPVCCSSCVSSFSLSLEFFYMARHLMYSYISGSPYFR
jgi:MoaA/NifB/PqqE/SkfB family radical SAM enzyme